MIKAVTKELKSLALIDSPEGLTNAGGKLLFQPVKLFKTLLFIAKPEPPELCLEGPVGGRTLLALPAKYRQMSQKAKHKSC